MSLFPDYSTMDRWVIVCGHGLFQARPLEEPLDVADPDNWYGLPRPGGASMVNVILKHIRWGVKQMLNSDRTLLVFSGCRSRGAYDETNKQFSGLLRSEAESYLDVTLRMAKKWKLNQKHLSRIILEPTAKTTLENVLASCGQAFELTQTKPSRIDVCTTKRKIRRMIHHIRTLGLGPMCDDDPPRAAGPDFHVKGIGNEFKGDPIGGRSADAGELDTLEKFMDDPLGLEAKLSSIRFDHQHSAFRNPFLRPHVAGLHAAKSWPQLYGQLMAALHPDH